MADWIPFTIIAFIGFNVLYVLWLVWQREKYIEDTAEVVKPLPGDWRER